MAKDQPGIIALIGSGETTRLGGQVFERLIEAFPSGGRIAILETPAGFELNSAGVAGRVGDFLESRLQNFRPEITIIPARSRGSEFSPDDPKVIQPLAGANLIFMGPGSPTYAIRQLQGSLAWEMLTARIKRGAGLVLASAAAIAIGRYALPVYEIYKVGLDPHWVEGLNLLGSQGLDLTIIPHWNNHEGGDDLDTSHCFMGESRFRVLQRILPGETTILGLDEQTTLVIDRVKGQCDVMGAGQVHIIRGGSETVHRADETFAIGELGDYQPRLSEEELSPLIKKMLAEWQQSNKQLSIPAEVLELVRERQLAREQEDWQAADLCRGKIESLGWQVTDTSEGPILKIQK